MRITTLGMVTVVDGIHGIIHITDIQIIIMEEAAIGPVITMDTTMVIMIEMVMEDLIIIEALTTAVAILQEQPFLEIRPHPEIQVEPLVIHELPLLLDLRL